MKEADEYIGLLVGKKIDFYEKSDMWFIFTNTAGNFRKFLVDKSIESTFQRVLPTH